MSKIEWPTVMVIQDGLDNTMGQFPMNGVETVHRALPTQWYWRLWYRGQGRWYLVRPELLKVWDRTRAAVRYLHETKIDISIRISRRP